MEFSDKQTEISSKVDLPLVSKNCWNEDRIQIRDWLSEQSPSSADLYESAVSLMFERPLPGQVKLVCHCIREICNRLVFVAVGKKSGDRLEYRERIEKITTIWENKGLSTDGAFLKSEITSEVDLPSSSADISIPSDLFFEINKIIVDHVKISTQLDERAFKFFVVFFPDNHNYQDSLRPQVDQWKKLIKWFQEEVHDNGRVNADYDKKELLSKFELFESFLASFARSFYRTTDELDKILEDTNLEEIEKTISLLIHPQQRIYFFNRLQNPEWIKPLQKKGFFQHPPKIIQHSNEGTVSFPIWAESRYLARMATYEPDTILKIIQGIQTDNPNIQLDLIDAALKMPSKVAVQLVSKFKTWLELPYSPNWIVEKIGDFIIHLAKSGQKKKALDLTRTLLAVMQDKNSNNRVYGSLPTPQIRLDDWNYEKILKEYVPELIEVAGEKAWITLIFCLNDAIKHSGCDEQQNDCLIWEDYSRIWRCAIEDSHPNRDDLKNILTTSIRDTAAQILSKDPTKMQSLVQHLENRRWRIFHRIALSLIREFSSKDSSLFLQKVVDHKRFTDASRYEDYEYAILLQENFDKLPIEEKEKILRWIENPELELSWQDNEDEKARWIRYWQLRKLTPIKNYIPASWQQRYKQLVDEFGATEFSDIVSEGVSKVRVIGTSSPKTDSELESMSIEKMILFLKTWEPKSTDPWDYHEPSRQGLGSSLTRLAEKNPLRYAQAAEQFQGLHPTYLWNLLWGLQKALNNQKTQQASAALQEFPWSSVLNLCHWLVKESQQIYEPKTTDIESSSPWHQTCRSVADLLATGLTLEPIGIPFNLREFVWNILKPLTEYPDPPPKGERDYTSSNMNPHELSVDTVRGEAMHTVVRYALWIRQHFEQMSDSQELLERGFEEMPEVQQVLDTHLNLDQERSLAIRSVYGNWFPWLVLLDPCWTKQNVDKIFPRDETLSDFRRAAWETYITFCPVYNNVFSLLYQEYRCKELQT